MPRGSRFLRGNRLFAHQPEFATHPILDRVSKVHVLLQELLDVLASLSEAFATVRESRAALLDNLLLDGEVEQVAFT